MVLIFLGFQRGFWKSWSATPLLSECVLEDEAAEQADGQPVDDQPEHSRRQTVATCRKEMNRRKTEAASSFKYTAQILGQKFTTMLAMDGMEFLTRPLEQLFREGMTKMHTKLVL